MISEVFAIGDRVFVDTTEYAKRTTSAGHSPFRDTGTVMAIDEGGINVPLPYAVKMDHPHPGECHDCDNLILGSYGYWCDDTMIKHLYKKILNHEKTNRLKIIFNSCVP